MSRDPAIRSLLPTGKKKHHGSTICTFLGLPRPLFSPVGAATLSFGLRMVGAEASRPSVFVFLVRFAGAVGMVTN